MSNASEANFSVDRRNEGVTDQREGLRRYVTGEFRRSSNSKNLKYATFKTFLDPKLLVTGNSGKSVDF